MTQFLLNVLEYNSQPYDEVAPEKELMVFIIERAYLDAKYVGKCPQELSYKRDAIQWFNKNTKDSENYIFSFNSICRELDISVIVVNQILKSINQCSLEEAPRHKAYVFR